MSSVDDSGCKQRTPRLCGSSWFAVHFPHVMLKSLLDNWCEVIAIGEANLVLCSVLNTQYMTNPKPLLTRSKWNMGEILAFMA